MGLLNGVLRISEYASAVNIIPCHFGFLKYFFKAFVSHLLQSKQQNPDSLFEDEEYRPSPSPAPAFVSLIPIFPVSADHASITSAAVKEKLLVGEYNRVAERLKNENDDVEEPCCPVCLDNLEASQDVRELHNCRHVYHKQCLDAWVERGHVTCPLCRAKLLAADDQMSHRVEEEEPRDPWRSERMMYLFGEDVIF